MINSDKKIVILGSRGMVGSAIFREFESKGYKNITGIDRTEVNLLRQEDTEKFFREHKPDHVIVAAARVGGILANDTYRAEFIYQNIMIECNVIQAAHESGTEKLLFLGSSCIYPKLAEQPMKEEYLLTGELEATNEPYAIAKIAGIKLCENYYRQYGSNFFSVMPTNLYGPYDNFDLKSSHVLPALIRKFHEAKVNKQADVEVWGTGRPKREFLYVEELADAVRFIMENVEATDLYEKGISHINIGTGADLSIHDLAELIAKVVGYDGPIVFETSKPDGTPRKLLDVSRLNKLGWQHKLSLEEGIRKTYNWFLEHGA